MGGFMALTDKLIEKIARQFIKAEETGQPIGSIFYLKQI